jgi:hypothetical protein
VFRAIPPVDPGHYVRGQYDGYLDVPGVRPGSATETFAALRLEIDNWRRAGIPFFIRAGKLLAEHVTEMRVIFKRPARMIQGMNQFPQPGHPQSGVPGEKRLGRSLVGGLARTDPHRINVSQRERRDSPAPQGTFGGYDGASNTSRRQIPMGGCGQRQPGPKAVSARPYRSVCETIR